MSKEAIEKFTRGTTASGMSIVAAVALYIANELSGTKAALVEIRHDLRTHIEQTRTLIERLENRIEHLERKVGKMEGDFR